MIPGLNVENNVKPVKEMHSEDPPENNDTIILDATACLQDIAYQTDLNLLNDAREKAEYLIAILYGPQLHASEPRTYPETDMKLYLNTALKKIKSKKVISRSIEKQPGFLKRGIGHVYELLKGYNNIPLDKHDYKYFLLILSLYDQQWHPIAYTLLKLRFQQSKGTIFFYLTLDERKLITHEFEPSLI